MAEYVFPQKKCSCGLDLTSAAPAVSQTLMVQGKEVCNARCPECFRVYRMKPKKATAAEPTPT